MPYPNWSAGQTITAALLNAGKMEYVTNTAALTNSTTTMADATGLGFTVTANSRWLIIAEISYDGPTTDVKFAWTAPAGAAMGRNIIGQGSGTASNQAAADSVFIRRGTGTAQTIGGPASVSTAFSTYQEVIDLQVGATAGTVQFQFAEVAGGTATVQADSLIWYMQVA